MRIATTGERLKEYMETYDLRQIDLMHRIEPIAKKYGASLSKGAISQYCADRAQPGQLMVLAMSEALSVDPAWIMGADVPMRRKLSEGLGAEAAEFYVRFLKLSDRDKKIVMALLDTMVLTPESEPTGNKAVKEG